MLTSHQYASRPKRTSPCSQRQSSELNRSPTHRSHQSSFSVQRQPSQPGSSAAQQEAPTTVRPNLIYQSKFDRHVSAEVHTTLVLATNQAS